MTKRCSIPPAKPAKPYPDFPLTAHPAGQWCKKIRGRLYYFGAWDDPQGALDRYLAEKDALHAGKPARTDPDAPTVGYVCNHFLNAKRSLVDAGELSPRTWDEYREACVLLSRHLGKARLVADIHPDDFARLRKKMARRWGPVRLGNAIQRVRSVFKHALESRLIPAPVQFGPDFRRPTRKVLRLHRAERGEKLFAREEILLLLLAAPPHLEAMILLGINAGYGMADCAKLPAAALDLDNGWASFPRPKTGIPRRCWLWPETVAALREVLAGRPRPKEPGNAGLVFLTARGNSWRKQTGGGYAAQQFLGLLRALGVNGRKGLGFYALRHTFRTVADEAKDQPAADFIMGHESPHMSTVYRERISDDRLRAVAEHVRAWLFAPPPAGAAKNPSVE